MSTHFWRFASILEKEFGVPYDRTTDMVICPECGEAIRNKDWVFEDYTSSAEDEYAVYRCPICKQVLTCRPIEA